MEKSGVAGEFNPFESMSYVELCAMVLQYEDSRAMNELRRRFRPYAVKQSKRLGLDEESAEDAMNHWLLRLDRLTHYDGFKTWSYRVIRNRLIDIYRYHRRRNQIVGEVRDDVADHNQQDWVYHGEISPDNRLYRIAEELVQRFHYEFLWLSSKHLKDCEKLTQTEIAKTLGVNQSTVSRRMKTAKQRIENYLRECYPEIYEDDAAKNGLIRVVIDLCRQLLLARPVDRTEFHSGGDDSETL